MNPKTPVIPGSTAKEITFAKDQPQYQPLPAIRTPDGAILTRWEPTPEERRAIAEGGSIYLAVWTFNNPLQPVLLSAAVPEQFAFAVPPRTVEARPAPLRPHIRGMIGLNDDEAEATHLLIGCVVCEAVMTGTDFLYEECPGDQESV
jgi:hypothetical protein